jgi:hypothetical protein
MCKKLLVILVNKVGDPKRIIGKKWRAKEEERHKGSLTQKKKKNDTICMRSNVVKMNHLLVTARLLVPFIEFLRVARSAQAKVQQTLLFKMLFLKKTN